MVKIRRITTIRTTTFSIFFLIFSLFIAASSFAQDGHALFQANCASCHSVNKKVVGPALAGVEDRWTDPKMLHDWIHNNQKVLQSGYAYAVSLYNEYNKTPMNVFPNLTDK